MTLNECITKIDDLIPNAFTEEQKRAWLNQVECSIYNEIIRAHHNHDGITFDGIYQDTDGDLELIAHAPYDAIYTHWLEAQINYANKDTSGYNNAIAAFNAEYNAFQNYYNRTHRPYGCHFHYF